jgi:hypothetical protein
MKAPKQHIILSLWICTAQQGRINGAGSTGGGRSSGPKAVEARFLTYAARLGGNWLWVGLWKSLRQGTVGALLPAGSPLPWPAATPAGGGH